MAAFFSNFMRLLPLKKYLKVTLPAADLSSMDTGTDAALAAKLEALEETHRERVDTDAALFALSRATPPADLQLRLRVAISHEQVRAGRRWTGRLSYRWHLLRENTLRPLALHGAVAAMAVLLLVGGAATLGTVAPQTAVEANDIPLIGFSRPHFLYAAIDAHHSVTSSGEGALMVEAKVNAEGRVYDYRVISGTLDAATSDTLRERMLSSVFAPARVFGEPVRGTVVLTFADVNVQG